MTIFVKNKHTLQIDEFKFKCSIGKKGLTWNKKEGDKKTPKGIFKIENLYFRKDRIKEPLTSLKCVEIKKDMGWCHDNNYPKKYAAGLPSQTVVQGCPPAVGRSHRGAVPHGSCRAVPPLPAAGAVAPRWRVARVLRHPPRRACCRVCSAVPGLLCPR